MFRPAQFPEDGPSAGVTITAALASLYGAPGAPGHGNDRRDYAFRTGVSGRRTEGKFLAAHRAGIRRIRCYPRATEADIEDLPEDVRKELQIVFVARISEVIDAALEVLVANPPPPPIITSSHSDSLPRRGLMPVQRH